MRNRDIMKLVKRRVRGIEFFGLPGSGKTTVMRAAHEALLRNGCSSVVTNEALSKWLSRQGRLRRLKLVMVKPRMLVRHWRVVLPLVSSLRGPGRLPLKLGLVSPLYPIYLSEFLNEHNQFISIDQGAIQSLWSITAFASTHNERLLRDAMRLAVRSTPLAYVYVKARSRLAAERIAGRSTAESRFDAFSVKENTVWFKHNQGFFDLAHQELRSARVDVLSLDAEEPVESKVAQINDFVRELQKVSAR
jgi:thymidylate kinase